jgi:hypothetical protein
MDRSKHLRGILAASGIPPSDPSIGNARTPFAIKETQSAGAIGAVHECLVVTSCPRRQLRAKKGKNSPLSDPFAGSTRNKAFSSLFPS